MRPTLTPAPPFDGAPRGVDGSRKRLCLTCDAEAAPDSPHCAPCGAEVENDPHPELVV